MFHSIYILRNTPWDARDNKKVQSIPVHSLVLYVVFYIFLFGQLGWYFKIQTNRQIRKRIPKSTYKIVNKYLKNNGTFKSLRAENNVLYFCFCISIRGTWLAISNRRKYWKFENDIQKIYFLKEKIVLIYIYIVKEKKNSRYTRLRQFKTAEKTKHIKKTSWK